MVIPISPYGEMALWVECDLCGQLYGEPGMNEAIVAMEHVNECLDCLGKSRRQCRTSAEGVGCQDPQFWVGGWGKSADNWLVWLIAYPYTLTVNPLHSR